MKTKKILIECEVESGLGNNTIESLIENTLLRIKCKKIVVRLYNK